MIPDPTQQLFDVGQRVMRTLRPLVVAPQLGSLPEGCRDLLLDPIEILSYTCGQLVGRVATEPALISDQPHDPPSLDQSAGPLTPFSRAVDGATTGAPGWSFDRQGGSQKELLAYGPGEPSFPAQVRRTTDAPPSLFRDSPAMHPGSPGSHIMTRPDKPGGDPGSLAHARQPLGGGSSDLHGATRTFEQRTIVEEDTPGSEDSYGESSFEADADASRPAQRRGPEGERAGQRREATALTRADSARDGHPADEPGLAEKIVPAEHDPVQMPPDWPASRRTNEEPTPKAPETAIADEREGTRLVSDPSRIVAMLRANVVTPGAPYGSPNMAPFRSPDSVPVDDGAATIGPRSEDGRPVYPTAGWDLRRPADRIGVEEVLERLAEELETEYVRTYGSSGG